MVEDTANSEHLIKIRIDTSSSFLSNSIFVKAEEVTKIGISESGTTGDYASFDLSNGVLIASGGNPSFSIKEMSNDWYRISLTSNSQLSRNDFNLALLPDDYVSGIPYTQNYQGNGTSGIYIFGAQIEEGSYATSYIKTVGTAQTRVADIANKTGLTNLIGQSEGTILVDVDFKTLSGTNMFLSIRPDASSKIEIYRGDAAIYGELTSNASFNFNKPIVTIGRYKIAIVYSSGYSAMYINGVIIGSNTATFEFASTFDDIYINSRGTTFIEQSNYKDVRVYTTALSDAELTTLTTI